MKNLVVLLFTFSAINLFSQNWLKVDSIFAVSGVTVKSFSAPEFADLNNDGNPDLILGNIDDAADFFWNNSHTFPTTFSKDTSVLYNIYNSGQTNTNSDYPTLIDLDNDNDLDLVIGVIMVCVIMKISEQFLLQILLLWTQYLQTLIHK